MSKDEHFKVCPMCSKVWESREDFIDDTDLIINGYQVDFETIDWSLFYFTHKKKGCDGTMAIKATAFLDMYSGERYTERQTYKDGCSGRCFDQEDLSRCDSICECAFNWEISNLINQRKLKLQGTF